MMEEAVYTELHDNWWHSVYLNSACVWRVTTTSMLMFCYFLINLLELEKKNNSGGFRSTDSLVNNITNTS